MLPGQRTEDRGPRLEPLDGLLRALPGDAAVEARRRDVHDGDVERFEPGPTAPPMPRCRGAHCGGDEVFGQA